MADLKDLEDQLKEIGCNFRFWGRAELKELANVLFPDEKVENCVNGQYEGGFAMLVATDQRVLLIDKKPMYLTLEDIRYDMIAEIDYNHRLMNATIFVRTPNKSLRFVAYNHARLRKLFHFAQHRVMEIRQHYQQQSQIWKQYAEGLQSPQQQNVIAATPAEIAARGQVSPDAVQQTAPIPMPAFPMTAPIISAYTRLPMMSRQRRFLGSRAVNTSSMPSIYPAPNPEQ